MIIIETPAPPTRERLVLVRERVIVPESRDATPADMARGGWVTEAEAIAGNVLDFVAHTFDSGIGSPQAAWIRVLHEYGAVITRAEKAERELDEALGRAQSETEWRVRAVSERQDAEAERDTLRAELARLTAPAKDRATDEELVTIGHAVGKSQAFDGVPEGRGNTWEAWRKGCDLAIVRAVAARVRQERCLVAQAVGMGCDIHVTEEINGAWCVRVVAPTGDAYGTPTVTSRADVPATLARLLGEVSRG